MFYYVFLIYVTQLEFKNKVTGPNKLIFNLPGFQRKVTDGNATSPGGRGESENQIGKG